MRTRNSWTEAERDSLWYGSQRSRTRPRRSSSHGMQWTDSTPRRPASHHRARSFSTVDDHHKSQKPEPGAFKVVIDRFETARLRTTEQHSSSLPTLEVSIPHYRLGTPRFSTRGTAFLRSSVYTRTSTSEDLRSSVFSKEEYDKLFPAPPGMTSRSLLLSGHSHASEQPHYIRIAPAGGVTNSSGVSPSAGLHQLKEPITPSIFDALASNPDDAAIVRYSSTGDITAATPARIIAQITSKTTVDYELVSDFFLTYRSYLSSHDLLAYLLARFYWAINGFDDDRRVIRVRVFAAIRHWILNYFVYDFVIDRELRVRFCDKVNSIGREVCSRPAKIASDIKLVADLKKCWNGRCVLYWDSKDFEGDGDAEIDIIPGGIAGSRDSQLSDPSQLIRGANDATAPQIGPVAVEGTHNASLHNWFEDVDRQGWIEHPDHRQQTSMPPARVLPASPISEHSVHITSCSVPPRSFKKPLPVSSRAAGVNAVPLDSVTAETLKFAHPGHGHKRSGSFSDAFRDHRAPLPSAKADFRDYQPKMAYFYAGSLIRGSLFLPVQPYIDTLAPTTPINELPNTHPFRLGIDKILTESTKPNAMANPGMRTLLGSIRRALSTKQSSTNSLPTRGRSVGPTSSFAGKNSTVPANVPHRAEERTRAKDADWDGHLRVDLLASAITEAFRRATEEDPYALPIHQSSIGVAFGNERLQPSPEVVLPDRHDTLLANGRQRNEVTPGSRSITMMDGTALDRPLMSGALPAHISISTTNKEPMAGPLPDLATSSRERSMVLEHSSQEDREIHPIDPVSGRPLKSDVAVLTDSGLAQSVNAVRSPETSFKGGTEHPLPARGNSFRSARSGKVSIRRYQSFQSGIKRHVGKPSFHSGATSDIGDDRTDGAIERAPARMLRRRPGGDLRAAQNVRTLEQPRRPRSTGSITTYSDSYSGSALYMTTSRRIPGEVTGIVATASVRHPVSMMESRSSQAPLRPSFEAAIIEFSNIPDDLDGGIESALLKLEGRYGSSSPHESLQSTADGLTEPGSDHPPTLARETGKLSNALRASSEDGSPQTYENPGHHEAPDELDVTAPRSSGKSTLRGQSASFGLSNSPIAPSEDSYNSTPLLERGLSNKSMKRRKPNADWPEMVMPQPLFSRNQSTLDTSPASPDPSFEYMQDTDSLRRMGPRSTYTQRTPTTDSFLLDEDEDLSDLSSEISMEAIDQEETTDRYFKPVLQFTPGFSVSETGMFSHPLRHPPSPPMTMENALSAKSQQSHMPFHDRLPTPDPSPTTRSRQHNLDIPHTGPKGSANGLGNLGRNTPDDSKSSEHLPFILAYDSEALAQQFTIIEEDALSEIDWKDLVDMSWRHTPPPCQNWVDYLRTVDPKGIDIVTARFNVMVKWALSEIVLTENLKERVRTIIKYIHVAQHARKCHNYATMLQLTIALTSIDCTRLTKTWELVPTTEKQVLKELEKLIQPMRNFHNLRMEMETVNGEEGCIPVLALYIHDLTYNAQKPGRITVTKDGEPLVNFERYRTAASIVKSLLRLIDASTKYAYQPVEGLIERCLWMSALSDEKIRALSKELE